MSFLEKVSNIENIIINRNLCLLIFLLTFTLQKYLKNIK